MDFKLALKQLKIYADEFTKIQDPEYEIKNNEAEFMEKLQKIKQYFIYIITKSEIGSDEWHEACDIIGDIEFKNPKLEKWIELILNPDSEKTQSEEIDTTEITGPIESLINEIKNMQTWNTDHVDDIEWELQNYKEKLIENQNAFEPDVFHSYMDDIDATLNKINLFKNTIEKFKII